jgi:20S proteasome subunit beta 2
MEPRTFEEEGTSLGFNFENFRRNQMIADQLPNLTEGQTFRPMSTGTTIVGLIFKNGIVLAADTRATGGSEVADKNCEKIHYIAPNIFCCGAGTAADTEKTTEMIASQLELLRLTTRTESRVITACTMLKRLLFRYQGHVSAALILGGVDKTGPHLYSIFPHGSTQTNPYVTMGSGSLAAMSVFETRYQPDMEEEQAVELARDAILAGIFNDLGSGSNVDITVIRKDGDVSRMRNFMTPNEVSVIREGVERPLKLHCPPGTTRVLSSSFRPHSSIHPMVEVEEIEAEQL